MNHNRLKQLINRHYRGYDQDEDTTMTDNALEELLVDMLPSGSGIDYDWRFKWYKNGNFRVYNAFHLIDEHGFYRRPVMFSVWFIRRQSGKLDWKVSCINQGASWEFGLRDYLEDTITYALPF